LGLAGKTLVIFSSDNGPWWQGNPGYARGRKLLWFEGGFRVPFLARWPAVIPPGSVCPHTICTTDLMATAAEVAGAALPPNAGEDSYSLMPLFRGESVEGDFREATVHHSISGHFAIRKGKWKLLEARGSGGWSFPTEKQGEAWGLPAVQLYDLENDPRESTNLASAFPEKVAELQALLNRYRQENRSAPLPAQPR
ncbi:MAG: sulfatase-like hydrolase/transferase, partial [Armatimonadota bacterium]|nr:sulfatase-like hydrolase/transferase [Armatimonadota bacterium]